MTPNPQDEQTDEHCELEGEPTRWTTSFTGGAFHATHQARNGECIEGMGESHDEVISIAAHASTRRNDRVVNVLQHTQELAL